MEKQKETFQNLMREFQYRHEPRSVFDDFLTMSICSLSQNPATGKSHYEDLYLETIAKYKDEKLRFNFPKMFAALVLEMEERVNDSQGNDVLGDYYQEHLYRKGTSQYFTPFPVCDFMARATMGENKEPGKLQRVLDPCCGSGRMLLASAKVGGRNYEYFGIDIDLTCVKMATLNLFLNGVFRAEIMCADALRPEDFRCSYRLSFLPLRIFIIQTKEQSALWHLMKNSFAKKQAKPEIKLDPKGNGFPGSQLEIF